jgi:hypothetical protein
LEVQFEEQNRTVGKVLVADFISALLQEVRYSYQNETESPYPQPLWLRKLLQNKEEYFLKLGTPTSEVIPINNSTDVDELKEALKEKIVPLIYALVRIDAVPVGLTGYREELLRNISVIMKKVHRTDVNERHALI